MKTFMATRIWQLLAKPLLALLIIGAGGAAIFALVHLDRWTELPQSYRLDLSEQLRVDPQLLHYRQEAEYPLTLAEPSALAVGPDDRIYVAGRNAISILSPDGQPGSTISVAGRPLCLAVGGPTHAAPGRLYVALPDRVQLFAAEGQPDGVWDRFGEKSVFTSLALGDKEVFLADAGKRVVLRLDLEGNVSQKIGEVDNGKTAPGFIIPSPYFDLVAGPDGTVHVVNPGARRIETYAATGELETVWGKGGPQLAQFFGCCNPTHLAQLADGRFVTSEKGVPRIKIYNREGDLQSVVAGPEQLGIPAGSLGDARGALDRWVFDVAADRQGRILVLDSVHQCVRVFVRRVVQGKE